MCNNVGWIYYQQKNNFAEIQLVQNKNCKAELYQRTKLTFFFFLLHLLSSISAVAAKSLQSCETLATPYQQPTRLPLPWDSPGKNTGVSCHFLLQCMKVKSENEVSQSCWTLSDSQQPTRLFHLRPFQILKIQEASVNLKSSNFHPLSRFQFTVTFILFVHSFSAPGNPRPSGSHPLPWPVTPHTLHTYSHPFFPLLVNAHLFFKSFFTSLPWLTISRFSQIKWLIQKIKRSMSSC